MHIRLDFFVAALAICLGLSLVPNAFGYATETHAAMTGAAVAKSNLTNSPQTSTLIARLGLNTLDSSRPFDPASVSEQICGQQNSLAGRYIVLTPPPTSLFAQCFEQARMKAVRDVIGESIIPSDYTIAGWMIRGVIREDVNLVEVKNGDEPGGVFNRVFGHFYDPLTGNGLPLVGAPAVDWPFIKGAAVRLPNRENIYNIPNARETMWRALTLTDSTSTPITPLSGISDAANKDAERKAYWATTFRTLGDVVHVLQDMAQPQHTRIDAHSGLGCIPLTNICLLGHDSFYENYIKTRTLGQNRFSIAEGFFTAPQVEKEVVYATTPKPLIYDTYAKPQFATYQDFFRTSGVSNTDGRGLANYSNRGFYTAGTNISLPVPNPAPYPSPDPGGYGLTSETIPTNLPGSEKLTNMAGLEIGGSMTFLSGAVTDKVTNTSDTIRLSTLSAWDQFTKQEGLLSTYTLNYYNYDAMADLLIPRAVAYSAGLIDYFFRGQLEITPPDEGVYSLVDHFDFAGENQTATNPGQGFIGFKTIKLKLRNTTPDITPSGGGAAVAQNMVNGKLVAVLKFHRNLSYADDLSGEPDSGSTYAATRSANEEIVVSDRVKDENGNPVSTITLNSNTATAKLLYFEFDKQLPINATDVYLQVVYRGELGSEADAVVVQTLDISEPTYFAYMNASDYIRLNSKVYTRAEINSNSPPAGGELSGSQLRALVQPTSCIDSMTDQLSANCFPNIPINFALKLGTIANNTTMQLAPTNVRTYVRMSMLTPKDVPAQLDQSDSNCVPNNVVPLPGRILQTNYSIDADGSQRTNVTVNLFPPPVRGVYGNTLSCVILGDGTPTAPNSNDNRDIKMTPLTGTNLKPIQITGFKFGAP